jgi:hypothetical protein
MSKTGFLLQRILHGQYIYMQNILLILYVRDVLLPFSRASSDFCQQLCLKLIIFHNSLTILWSIILLCRISRTVHWSLADQMGYILPRMQTWSNHRWISKQANRLEVNLWWISKAPLMHTSPGGITAMSKCVEVVDLLNWVSKIIWAFYRDDAVWATVCQRGPITRMPYVVNIGTFKSATCWGTLEALLRSYFRGY